jgi:biopolymer transport protein TolR
VILSISKAGEFFVGDERFLKEELPEVILGGFKQYKTDVLYLRADYSLDYGVVAKLISQLKKEGIAKIALVTEITNKDD